MKLKLFPSRYALINAFALLFLALSFLTLIDVKKCARLALNNWPIDVK